jgi:hypothetical protein
LRLDATGAQRASLHRVLGTPTLVIALALALVTLTVTSAPAGAADAATVAGTPAAGTLAAATPAPVAESNALAAALTEASPSPTASPDDPATLTSSPSTAPSATPPSAPPTAPSSATPSSPTTTSSPAPAPTSTATPTPAARVRPKVVVIVGPVGSKTATYIRRARALAAEARALGARVVELYSPNATWARVKAAANGAKVLIYLGHGNGYPNPYGPFDATKVDGLGLNAAAGRGNSDTRYYGEALVVRGIRLAPGAIVILNHLCYAAGANEWGRGNPTRATAIRRVDNFGAGFLRAGAVAVFADGLNSPGYVLASLFRTNRTVRQIFWATSAATKSHTIAFASRRTPGARALMDPYAPARYYRSVIGKLDVRVSAWR